MLHGTAMRHFCCILALAAACLFSHPVAAQETGARIVNGSFVLLSNNPGAPALQFGFVAGFRLSGRKPGLHGMLAGDFSDFTRWIRYSSVLAANTLLVGQVPPAFYQALSAFNAEQLANGGSPMMFVQQVRVHFSLR